MTPQLWGLHQADRLECGPSGNTVRDARYCIVVPLFTKKTTGDFFSEVSEEDQLLKASLSGVATLRTGP